MTADTNKKLLEKRKGKFKTFGKDGEAFRFTASSCAQTLSDSEVFETMVSNDPHLVINLGDMHYAGIGGAKSKFFQLAYHEMFKSTEMRAMYENYSLVYTFDDHDVGADNSNGLNKSTPQANIAYRSVFPHYPLQSSDKERGIWQSFKAESTLFIITDSRSFLFTTREDGQETVFGTEQLEWIQSQLE